MLFWGTSEKVAKSLPRNGFRPADVLEKIHLTDCFPLYQAFQSCEPNERWAVVELNSNGLHISSLNKQDWRICLEKTGFCCCDEISPNDVRNIWIIDPRPYRLLIHKILNMSPTPKYKKNNLQELTSLQEWVMGSVVRAREILGKEVTKFTPDEIDVMDNQIFCRDGYDHFFIRPSGRRNQLSSEDDDLQ